MTSPRPLADALQCRPSTVHALRRLTSIEAFALALVEASSSVEGASLATASESTAREDGAPAAE